MHRVDTQFAVASLPDSQPPGTPGFFSGGNPETGQLATVPGPDWMNSVQEEIAAAVEGAGIGLDKDNNAQLLAAIQALVSASIAPLWSTGDVKATFKNVADTGWVMMNDGSIGTAGSGATTRAHADTEDLFVLLWNNVNNTWAPVSGGRGATALGDFNAGKTLTLPKALGRAIAAAGAGSGLTLRALGETLGQEEVALSGSEGPIHLHGAGGLTAANHTHPPGTLTLRKRTSPVSGGDDLDTVHTGPNDGTFFTSASDWNGGATGGSGSLSVSGNTANAGSGEPHENMQPTTFMNFMVKL